MQGSMMQLPLLISSLLVHAERHHLLLGWIIRGLMSPSVRQEFA